MPRKSKAKTRAKMPMHKMPNGHMMKDSEMKKRMGKKMPMRKHKGY